MDPSGPVGQPTLADAPALSERPDAPALRRSSATPAIASRPIPRTPTGTAVRAVRLRTCANVAVSGIGPTPVPPCWADSGLVGVLPLCGAPFVPAFVNDSPRTTVLGQDELSVTHAEPFGCTAWLAAAAPDVDPEVVPDEPTISAPLVFGAEVPWRLAESTPPNPFMVRVAHESWPGVADPLTVVPGARVKFWPPIPSWPGVLPDGWVKEVIVPQ